MKIKSYTELFIFIVTAELVGALSALVTGDFSGFFNKYSQPPLLPPLSTERLKISMKFEQASGTKLNNDRMLFSE